MRLWLWGLLLAFDSAYGVKGNQPIYQDPFDLAGGGASLTRASQESVVFANPALMPWGKKIYRYVGLHNGVRYTPESYNQIATFAGQEEPLGDVVDVLFETPIYFGAFSVLGLVFKNVAFAAGANQWLDIAGGEHSSAVGGPGIDVWSGAYGFGAFGFAGEVSRWFSIGLTPKYIYKSEAQLNIPLTDRVGIARLQQDPSSITDAIEPGVGTGFDLGMLFFFQGRSVDYRLALKVDDIGDTQFTANQEPFLQTVSFGQSLTFHGPTHAIHLALDYRDALDAYEDKLFKKVYAGMKILLQEHLGFAMGLHHALPSFGVRLDLFAIKLGVTQYGRELTNVIGEKRRYITEVNFAMGW